MCCGRPLAAAVLLGLAACGAARRDGDAGPGDDRRRYPRAAEGLVLRAEYTGGFVSPSVTAARLPLVSVYADGRVLSEGPVAAIYPGPALPNLQEQQIDQGAVQDLVDRAMAAGVAETSDLGTPPVADATSHPVHPRHGRPTPTCARPTRCRRRPAEGSGLTPSSSRPPARS